MFAGHIFRCLCIGIPFFTEVIYDIWSWYVFLFVHFGSVLIISSSVPKSRINYKGLWCKSTAPQISLKICPTILNLIDVCSGVLCNCLWKRLSPQSRSCISAYPLPLVYMSVHHRRSYPLPLRVFQLLYNSGFLQTTKSWENHIKFKPSLESQGKSGIFENF